MIIILGTWMAANAVATYGIYKSRKAILELIDSLRDSVERLDKGWKVLGKCIDSFKKVLTKHKEVK